MAFMAPSRSQDSERPRRWPATIFASGSEPDPRFSLANERTFLAWIRTTIALLAASIALDAFVLRIPAIIQAALAIIFAIAAVFTSIQAWRGWAGNERAMRHDRPLPAPTPNIYLAGAMVVLAVILITVPMFWWIG